MYIYIYIDTHIHIYIYIYIYIKSGVPESDMSVYVESERLCTCKDLITFLRHQNTQDPWLNITAVVSAFFVAGFVHKSIYIHIYLYIIYICTEILCIYIYTYMIYIYMYTIYIYTNIFVNRCIYIYKYT